MKEKLELCNATERTRIAFGKSGIHGWGLFARVPMRQDSMVTEYRWVQGVVWCGVLWCDVGWLHLGKSIALGWMHAHALWRCTGEQWWMGAVVSVQCVQRSESLTVSGALPARLGASHPPVSLAAP